MKKIISFVLVLITITVSAQNKQAKELYNKGIEAFDEQDFKTADSLLTLSAKSYPDKETYMDLALTKKELGNRCAYCDYLLEASKLNNFKAEKLLNKDCITKDTIIYLNVKEKDVIYYCISSKIGCSDKMDNKFIKDYQDGDSAFSFKILPSESFQFKEEDCLSPTFDIEKAAKENMEQIKPPPFIVVEEMPSFPGGDKARIKFFVENIVYPMFAKKNNIQGVVYVTFIIEKDGTITNIKVLRGIGGGCDEEAIRVVKLMPKWVPGKQSGKFVRVEYILPIGFTLQNKK